MQTSINDSGTYINNFLTQIVSYLPKVLAALLILIIGAIIASIIAGVIKKALGAAKLNERLHNAKGGGMIKKAVPDPAGIIGKVVYWLIFLFVISIAAAALGIPAINDFLHGVYGYVPNVIAALLIFIIAGTVSAGVSTLLAATMGETPTGKIAATAAPIVIMGLATFMILNQLQIAPEIVTITYAGLVLTAVLAFGLGGKDAASQMLMTVYQAGQAKSADAKSDFAQGVGKAKDKAQDLRDRIQ